MQDNQSLAYSVERPVGGGCLADLSSHSSDFTLDNVMQDNSSDSSEASDLAITAEVLSSIRKRFFPNNFESNVLPDHGFGKLNGRTQSHVSTDSVKDLESLDHGEQYQCKYSLSSNGSYGVPSHHSFSSLESPSSLDQNFISASRDGQRSPDSTFSQSPVSKNPKEESLDGSYEFPPGSEYSDGCGSTLSGCTMPRVDGGFPQKEKAQTKNSHILPPCRVCGDKASGFHYGANTCEACKGFFRRSLKKDTIEYKCSGNNRCPIQKGRRNNCPLCRYNKCLAIGMSKNAIKTGRYTHEKRTKDIVEVKQLKGDYVPVTSQSRRESDNNSPTSQPAALSPENEKLLARIYGAHKVLFPFWHKIQETGEVYMNMRNYAEKYKHKKSVNELSIQLEMEPTSLKMDEDIGNRFSTIQLITNHLELAITVFVKFAKAIPGFCDLTLNDQASLVKLSRFEVWMIGAHKFFNCELGVVSGPRGNSYHMEELCDVMDRDFVRAMFTFSKTLQSIPLSNEETALIKCVVLTFSDRSSLQEPEKIDQIQLRLISCLESLVNSVRRFSQIMNALVSLRDLTDWHQRISEDLILEWPAIQRNPLLLEIMSV